MKKNSIWFVFDSFENIMNCLHWKYEALNADYDTAMTISYRHLCNTVQFDFFIIQMPNKCENIRIHNIFPIKIINSISVCIWIEFQKRSHSHCQVKKTNKSNL